MFLLIKIFVYIITNLAGNINNIAAYHVNRDCLEGPAITAAGGGEEGYAIPRPGLI
jgi:hypothetical protein